MKIAIIGTGNIGSALAKGLLKAKHTILIGAQFPLSGSSVQLATEIGEDRFNTIEGAMKQCDVIIIAVPLNAIPDVAKKLGKADGKIIIE